MHVQMSTKFDERLTKCIYYKVQANRIVRICPKPTIIQKPQLQSTKLLQHQNNKTNYRYCNCCLLNYLDREYLQSTEGFFKLLEIVSKF